MTARKRALAHRTHVLLAVGCISICLLSACSKPPESSQPDTTTPASAPAQGENSLTSANKTVAAADTAVLTQVVRKYAAEKQRAPKSFDEIIAAGYLPSIPSAPAGKKYAIDKNLQVYLADQ